MRVLAFDTATALTAVALRDFDDAANASPRPVVDLTAVDDPPAGGRPGHAQRLLVLVNDLLERSGAGWEAVDRLAVGVGPGTFTGLRIGIATAQALAAATGTPLVGVSTLRSLEQAALASLAAPRPVLTVIDARRGEAFVGGAGLSPCVLTPEALGDVAGQRTSNGVIAVGDGAVKFRTLLERAGAHVPADAAPVHRVSAREHCRLALDAQPSRHGTVEPEYLRLPDAELAQGLTVRALSHGDLAQVLAIERRAFSSPWSLGMFVLEMSKPSGIHLAAVRGDQVAGYALCAHYFEAFHVMNLAVDPAQRRTGVASALLEAVIARAGEDANYTLEVRVSNTAAIALYERYGFHGVGRRRRYYADNGEDAIIMWRAVGTPWEPQ